MINVTFKDDNGKEYAQVPVGWVSYEANPILGQTRIINHELYYIGSVFKSYTKKRYNPFTPNNIILFGTNIKVNIPLNLMKN